MREAAGVLTRVLIFDFASLQDTETAQNLQRLLDSVKEDISILVNNVGVLPLGQIS